MLSEAAAIDVSLVALRASQRTTVATAIWRVF
jgi:hypothetical protein